MDLHVDFCSSISLKSFRVRFGNNFEVTCFMVFDLQVPIDIGINPIGRHSVDEERSCKIKRFKLDVTAGILITPPE